MSSKKTKKNIILFIFLLTIFIVPSCKVGASNLYISGNKAYMFSAATGSSSIIDVLLQGQNYEIISKAPAGGDCSTEWYQVKHNSSTGYICGEWITLQELTYKNDDANFQPTLDTFPKAYWPYLINLHKIYPNATFSPLNTNLNWDLAMQKQTSCNGTSCKSLIQVRKDSLSWWGSQYTDTSGIYSVPENLSGGGCSGSYCWYKASSEAVSTYMDPRNFLNSIFIFMFESNAYDSAVQNMTGLNNLIAGTFMDPSNANYNNYKLENGVLYSDTIMQAAKTSLISPYALAARIKQEIGVNGSTIISGTVPGYEGYYNYFNIDATGTNAITQGLQFAKNSDWSNRVKALMGGALFIGNNYAGTEYTQKWDVLGNDYTNYTDFFKTQYMQNIQAPASQTSTIYETYKSNNNLSFPFTFSIPVYNSMPNSETAIEAAIEMAGYTYGTDYITSVSAGSNLSTISSSIKTANNALTVTAKSADGAVTFAPTDRLGTGNVITITDGTTTENYRLVIKGDANGDGAINAVDYVSIRNHIMESSLLSSYYKLAADIDKNNSISSIDYINVRNYIMGNANLIK